MLVVYQVGRHGRPGLSDVAYGRGHRVVGSSAGRGSVVHDNGRSNRRRIDQEFRIPITQEGRAYGSRLLVSGSYHPNRLGRGCGVLRGVGRGHSAFVIEWDEVAAVIIQRGMDRLFNAVIPKERPRGSSAVLITYGPRFAFDDVDGRWTPLPVFAQATRDDESASILVVRSRRFDNLDSAIPY
jgi:hypothetical protein